MERGAWDKTSLFLLHIDLGSLLLILLLLGLHLLSPLKIGDEDSSCSLKKTALEDLASVFWWLRSLDKGKPRLTLSIAWKASNLLILLARPPLLLGFGLGV